MAVLLPNPIIQFFDNNGDPLSGGKLYTYAAGTTTPKATYTDSTGGTPLSNPVILDAYGRASIWVDGSYKYSLYTSADVLIRTEDNVSSFNSSASDINDLVPSQTGNSGKALVTDGASVSWGYPGPSLISFTDKILSGLVITNNAIDATNDIDVAAGYCVSDDGSTLMTLSAITKQLDAVWAVGTNQGGLDTGSASDTTYYVWIINRTDTNVTDVLFSTSATSPTMPTSYTKKKLIGSFVRASSAILSGPSSYADMVRTGTPIATTAGTTATFPIPANCRAVYVGFMGVSTNGTTNLNIQLNGETSGYVGATGINAATVAWSTSILATQVVTAATIYSGIITLRLMDKVTNAWAVSGSIGDSNGPYLHTSGGYKTLSAALSSLVVSSVGGNTFDAGKVNISYEVSQ